MKRRISISAKIMMVIVNTVLVLSLVNVIVANNVLGQRYADLTEYYIMDMTECAGSIVEEAVSVEGEAAYSSLELAERLSGIKLDTMESSYVYMVSTEGIMLYHPTPEKIGEPVENAVVKGIVEDIKAGKEETMSLVEYDFKGVMKYAGTYVNSDAGFILVVTADKDEMLTILHSNTYSLVFADIIASLICIIMGLLISRRYIVKPVRKLTDIIAKIGDMDFSPNAEVEKLGKQSDEIGFMSNSVETLRQNLSEIVKAIKGQCSQLQSAAEELNENAKETSNTIMQIETAVQEIAMGATAQAEDTQNATENVVLIGNMIEDTSQEVNALRDTADAMKEADEKAVEILERLEKINGQTRQSIDIISEQTNTTNESAVKIREATSLITSIAEETNLLALNASIEAARAGEQGRGFAVVASQIQKLAEQSNDSARQIEGIIDELIADSEKAVSTMKEVTDIIEVQSDNVNQTRTTFALVQEGIKRSISGIGNISKQTGQMDSTRGSVVEVVQNLTAIAEENAASTEETSASVVEVSNLVQDISQSSDLLYEIADKLENEVQKFKV